MKDKSMNIMLVVALLSAVSLLTMTFAFLGLKTSIEGAVIGGPANEPLCLWQIGGTGKDINQLISDTSVCARIFERYTAEGECSDSSGVLRVTGAKNEQITWNYDASCSKLIGGKRFTIYSGYQS